MKSSKKAQELFDKHGFEVANSIIDSLLDEHQKDLKQQMIDAYKKGYEQRVVDQLQGALDGSPVGSHYKEEKLKELANAYASKHCA